MHIYIYIYTKNMIHSQNIHHIHHNDSIYNITYDIYIYIIHILYTHMHLPLIVLMFARSPETQTQLFTEVAIPVSGHMSLLGVGSFITSLRSKCNACGTRMSKQVWASSNAASVSIHQKWRFLRGK